jgi:hypothetical protein
MTRLPHLFAASALSLALLATPLFAHAQAADAVAPASVPLGRALASFASQQGVALAFDPGLTAGRTAPTLAPDQSLEAGFAQLLAGTGLRATRRADGSYTLERAAAGRMPALRVGADAGSTFLPAQLPFGQGQRLDQDALQAQVKGNGDIATALRGNPAVQFSDSARSSRTMGEIRPADFSINGAPFYQNLFLLDGASINNDIDPTYTAQTIANVNSAVDVPSAAQGIAVDVDLLESLTVYDANVPAAYGGFTGGVIDAQSRKAGDALHGKVWMRMARSAWDQVITNPTQAESYEESATFAYQPAYDKLRLGARLEGRTRGGIGVIGMLSHTRSDIPLRAYANGQSTSGDDANRRTQLRENTAATVALDWSSGEGLDLTANLSYAPNDDRYFIMNTKDSWFDIRSGGPTAKLGATLQQGAWTFRNSLNYSDLESSRRSEGDTMKNWRPSEEFNWGIGSTSSIGNWGSVDQNDRRIGYRLGIDRDAFALGNSTHTVQFGLGVQRRDASYERPSDQYIYQGGVATRSCTLADGSIDTVSCSLSPLLTGTGTGQYLSQLFIYHAGAFEVSGTEYEAWAQDSIALGRWTLRPGLRLDRNDLFGQTDLSPRLALSWDVLGDERTLLNAGVNRYYGRSFFSYLLREGRERLRESKTRTRASTAWEDVTGTWNVATNRLRDLDSPYTDEWTLGIDQQFEHLQVHAKYVDRSTRRDVLRRKVGDPLDTTLYNRNTYEYTNDGRSDAQTWTLSLGSVRPLEAWGMQNSWQLSADYTDVARNYNDYEDTVDLTQLVRYEGELMYRYQLPATDYLRPWSVRLSTRTAVPVAGLTWNNFFRVQAGFEGTVTGASEIIDGLSVPTLTRRTYPRTWTWDSNVEYRLPLPRAQEAYARVEVMNVLNRSNQTSGTTAGNTYYEPGRSFWLELGYVF